MTVRPCIQRCMLFQMSLATIIDLIQCNALLLRRPPGRYLAQKNIDTTTMSCLTYAGCTQIGHVACGRERNMQCSILYFQIGSIPFEIKSERFFSFFRMTSIPSRVNISSSSCQMGSVPSEKTVCEIEPLDTGRREDDDLRIKIEALAAEVPRSTARSSAVARCEDSRETYDTNNLVYTYKHLCSPWRYSTYEIHTITYNYTFILHTLIT